MGSRRRLAWRLAWVATAIATCGAPVLAGAQPQQPQTITLQPAPPPVRVTSASPTIDREAVVRVVGSSLAPLRACADRLGLRDEDLIVGVTISPEGRAVGAGPRAPGRPHGGLVRCIREEARRWVFAPAVGRGDMELRFARRVGLIAVRRGADGGLGAIAPTASIMADPMGALGALVATTPEVTTPEQDASFVVDRAGIEIRDGAITRPDVTRRLATSRDSMRQCYVDELHRDPALIGRPRLLLILRPDGTVTSMQWIDPLVGSDAFRACLATQIRPMRFSRGPATIVVPLRLSRRSPVR